MPLCKRSPQNNFQNHRPLNQFLHPLSKSWGRKKKVFVAHLVLNIFLSQAGPAFTANPVKRYAGHKDGVWEVKVIHHLTSKIKTLPKAQRTRGLSSYHKLHTNLDQISSSESLPNINFKISTKHQRFD